MNPTADILAKLDEIDALAVKATEGPWRATDYHVPGEISVVDRDCIIVHTSTNHNSCNPSGQATSQLADTAFIAAARDGWPATVKALRVAVEALEELASADDKRPDEALAAVRSLLKGEQSG